MGEACPVYGSQGNRPLRVRALQIASVILAVAGLILLCFYSVNRDIPMIKVAEVSPTMNFAHVRISGTVTRDAYVFDSGGLIFNLHDGSGEIAVLGGRAQAETLKKNNRFPRRGDLVEVVGSLSTGADQEVKLRLQSADQLLLDRKRSPSVSYAIEPVRLQEISAAQEGERFSVSGTLKDVEIPGPGSNAPYVLTLEQDGTQLEVIFWGKVFRELEKTLPTPGILLRASGRVDVYKGTVQLKVWDASDLQEVSERNTPGGEGADLSKGKGCSNDEGGVSRIADIRADREGSVFTVTGVLGEPRSIRGGVIYPIRDDSAEMVVLFWNSNVAGEERDALEEGITLQVTAPLVVYNGTLELIPENAGAFSVE